MKTEIKIYETPEKLADHLANEFQNSVNQAAKFNRALFVALSGGGTPALFFQKLASAPYRENIAWEKVHFFWCDERCVPPNHPDSNYGVSKENLFDHISIPHINIHRMVGENNPEAEAKRYASEIAQWIPANQQGIPQMDWILLGLGADGHTASLFPNSPILKDREHICAVSTHPETEQQRITLTLLTINNGKNISFLVSGQDKAAVAAKILRGKEKLPASFVKPESGMLEWYLDSAAAHLI